MICLCFQVVIGVPNAMQRLSILKAHTQSLKLSDEVDLIHSTDPRGDNRVDPSSGSDVMTKFMINNRTDA